MPDDARTYLLAWRALPDGRELHVSPLTFGRARLHITPPGEQYFYDDAW